MLERRPPKPIPGYGKSYALLAKSQVVDTAVIFVHGFGGKPTSTWINFQGLVDEYSGEFTWWATSDMFFYAYESLHTPIRNNANLLEKFVEDVWHTNWKGNGSPSRAPKYDSLILAGHSEGGVVIRRLILDRFERIKEAVENASPDADEMALKAAMRPALDADFILGSYLRLFAPACRGTNFSSWAGLLTSLSHLVSAITASSLVRNELLPESPVLNALKTGTEQAHARFRGVRSLYTQPIFGVPDQIVYSESYQGESPLWDKGYDHFAVCKPNYTHKRPLEFVRK
jgi:pimeloyl-ACP methyl ester carboxylesterase